MIGIAVTGRAYLPEAYAYERYLRTAGYEVVLNDRPRDLPADASALLFSGRDLLDESIVARRIHEYHSLSVGTFGRLKDFLRASGMVAAPEGVILQDGLSRARFDNVLSPELPRFYRPMGIDREIFGCAHGQDRKPSFDLIYCGSLEGRSGLHGALADLAERGFSLLCVGKIGERFDAGALEKKGIRFTGQQSREQIPALLSSARAGLNWMPDVFPLNRQEATKVIEYAAAGLPTVSNRYEWAQGFAARDGSGVTWLDELEQPEDLGSSSIPSIDLRDREWHTLLDRLNFRGFIDAVTNR